MCRKRLSSPRCRSELIDSAWVVIVPGQKCINKKVNNTMENKGDTENKDMDLISMIKNVVLDERVGDKNIIKQYQDEIIFLRKEISEKRDTIKSVLDLLNHIKYQKVETTPNETCILNKNHDEVIKTNCFPANHRVIINDCLDGNLNDVNVAVFAGNYNKTVCANDMLRNSISDEVNSTINSESVDIIDNNSTLQSSEFNDDELFKELYHQYVMFTKRETDNRRNNDLYVNRKNKNNNYQNRKKQFTEMNLNDSNKSKINSHLVKENDVAVGVYVITNPL